MKKRCCFAGHSKIYDATAIERVLAEARRLVVEESVTEFLVGNYGDFDHCATSAIRLLKKEYETVELSLVVPYLTKEICDYQRDYYEKYDSIVMANIKENTPNRLKIIKANEYMVDSSDYVICYVDNDYGGAHKTLEYARRKQKSITNIGKLK